jgi:hypothetical protein
MLSAPPFVTRSRLGRWRATRGTTTSLRLPQRSGPRRRSPIGRGGEYIAGQCPHPFWAVVARIASIRSCARSRIRDHAGSSAIKYRARRRPDPLGIRPMSDSMPYKRQHILRVVMVGVGKNTFLDKLGGARRAGQPTCHQSTASITRTKSGTDGGRASLLEPSHYRGHPEPACRE